MSGFPSAANLVRTAGGVALFSATASRTVLWGQPANRANTFGGVSFLDASFASQRNTFPMVSLRFLLIILQ